MTFRIKYHCGETQIGETEQADSLEACYDRIALKKADLGHTADLVIIFRVSPSGTEELEESRKLLAQ